VPHSTPPTAARQCKIATNHEGTLKPPPESMPAAGVRRETLNDERIGTRAPEGQPIRQSHRNRHGQAIADLNIGRFGKTGGSHRPARQNTPAGRARARPAGFLNAARRVEYLNALLDCVDNVRLGMIFAKCSSAAAG
jgi:hypothetical protein